MVYTVTTSVYQAFNSTVSQAFNSTTTIVNPAVAEVADNNVNPAAAEVANNNVNPAAAEVADNNVNPAVAEVANNNVNPAVAEVANNNTMNDGLSETPLTATEVSSTETLFVPNGGSTLEDYGYILMNWFQSFEASAALVWISTEYLGWS